MLHDLAEFVKCHKDYIWIHWNMRNIKFGFQAIEHRYNVLTGTIQNQYNDFPIIDDMHKIDLSQLLVKKYSENYIDNPKMKKLVKFNNISDLDFLDGEEEADAFDNHEFIKLHNSTLRKVDCFADILTKVINNELRTKSKWYRIYGYTPQALFKLSQEKWIVAAIVGVISFILSKLADNYLSK